MSGPGISFQLLDGRQAAAHADELQALHADAAAVPSGVPITIRGAAAVARNARAASVRSRYSGVALVNGSAGIVMASRGRLAVVLAFTIAGDTISRIDVIADPARLEELDLAVLEA